jgi:hypothetical protein
MIWNPDQKRPLIEETHDTDLGPITFIREASLREVVRWLWYNLTHLIEDAEEEA